MLNPVVVMSLKNCDTGEKVDAVFDKFRMSDYKKRIKYLGHCQGNPQFFFTGAVKADAEEELRSKYLTVRSMFVTGSWR